MTSAATSAPHRFLVLARRAYAEALAYEGVLDVASDDHVAEMAAGRYGSDWLEMVLAPESAVHWVIGPEILEPTA